MKKFNLSLVAVLAMSTFAIAGGDIAPVEPVVEEVMVEEVSQGGFYLGLGYGFANMDLQLKADLPLGGSYTEDHSLGNYNTVMLQAGYEFNQYVALEGRYWIGLTESWSLDGRFGTTPSTDYDINTWGIYVKPQYPVTEAFDIYALLGYANTDEGVSSLRDTNLDGFSWGLGGSYAFTDNVSLFVDYVSMYSDSEDVPNGGLPANIDVDIDTWNFGITYQF